MLGLHAINGCDSTSGLCGIRKKKALAFLEKDPVVQQNIQQLGNIVPLSLETSAACEKFICSSYTTNKEGSADLIRHWMFCQKRQHNENLPPTSDSLQHHIDRSNYQALVWKRALEAKQQLPAPNGNGWIFKDGLLEPVLMSKDPAPKGLLELTFLYARSRHACKEAYVLAINRICHVQKHAFA